jgi:hypothetical protein
MKLLPIMGMLVVIGLTGTPAFAFYCADDGPSAGVDMDVGDAFDNFFRRGNEDQQNMDMARLHSVGVYPNSVERWSGCIRAYMPNGTGGEIMEFYDPATLKRIQ